MSITPPVGCLLSLAIIGLIDCLGILFGLQMLIKEASIGLLGILAACPDPMEVWECLIVKNKGLLYVPNGLFEL